MSKFLLLMVLYVLSVAFTQEHAPDHGSKIDRESTWCFHGSITRTTGECICSSHLGYFCKEAEPPAAGATAVDMVCQQGFGISFFHNSCKSCTCTHESKMTSEWLERRNALRSGVRKQQKEMKLMKKQSSLSEK